MTASASRSPDAMRSRSSGSVGSVATLMGDWGVARPKFQKISYADRRRAPLANLLPPHREIQALLRHELIVASGFDDTTALQHVNPVGVQNRRQAVCDENRDRVA